MLSIRNRVASASFVRQIVLVGVPAVTLALAIAAWRSESSHRAAAENTMRGYAGVAGTEFIRRTAFDVGFNGYQVVIDSLKRAATQGRAALPPDLDPEVLALVAHLFIVEDDRLRQISGVPADESTRGWVLDALRTFPREGNGIEFRHRSTAGKAQTLVLGSIRDGPRTLAAFDVDLKALRPFLQRSLDRGPLLPQAVGDGSVTNSALAVSFLDHGNEEVFHAGAPPASENKVSVPFAVFYYGVLAGSRVNVSIDPSVATRLIVGGVPPPRTPALIALFSASLLLMLLAAHQAKRERDFLRMRDDFVVGVSHELRTPLAQIRLFTETILLGRCRSKDEERRFLEGVSREAIRLSRLVDNILDFSRAERGTIDVALSPRRLAPLIESIVRSFTPLADTKRIQVREDLDPLAAAAVDEPRFQQLLLNLLDNALKYGPEAGEVTVRLVCDREGVEVSVEDRGPGVPASERERVFDPFQRLDRDRQTGATGSGLGLGIVRELVALHGGSCRVEDRDGGGARFVVRLPGATSREAA